MIRLNDSFIDKVIWSLILTVFFVLIHLPRNAFADNGDLPFQPGEKLTFELKWSFIPAGKAVLQVLPVETVNGIEVYHFVMIAETNAFVDIFYKVRDKIDAYTDTAMTRTILYKKKQHEGHTRRNVTVQFDWDHNKAQYITANAKKEPISILPCSFDPLAIFYLVRSLDLEKGMEIEHPVTDGEKCVIGKAKIIRQEKIKLPSGEFDTYLMEPDLKHVGGVFKKSKDAKIKLWVTTDDRRLLVKIQSKVAVGSFVGELISAEGI